MFLKSLILITFLIVSSCDIANNTTCNDFVAVKFKNSIICVSPDYYSVDDVRTPMGMSKINSLLKEKDATLPTPEMVDAIWKQADLKLKPIPMKPGPHMSSVEYYRKHDRLIDDRIGNKLYRLVAGHKKDVVKQRRSDRVTIYGWHRLDGSVIQPVSSVHGSEYFDYSHGIRLVRVLSNE